jgi:hypothetical protein
MKMEAVYSSETVVLIATVSQPYSLGVYLHPALKKAMFRAVHASCEGESAVHHDSSFRAARAVCSDAVLICVLHCEVCLVSAHSAVWKCWPSPLIHSTALYTGCTLTSINVSLGYTV